jgi:hypothetical protein
MVPPKSVLYIVVVGRRKSKLFFACKFDAMGTQGAISTFWPLGGANLPAEEHDAVAKIAAFLRRQDAAQLPLHLLWVFAFGKT